MSQFLKAISEPADLRRLSLEQMAELSQEIRTFLVAKVAATGGHLGPNLGVVELTLALHRVFDSPRDALIFDTGHQTYVHKMVTGRCADFDTLRQPGGLSGYPSRSESAHDWVENSHASTALAYADGLAKAWQLSHEPVERHVVAVVGDGSLTGGMAWEALNNIAGGDRQVVIVVNDNERSYSPTIGGVAYHLGTLRTTKGYERFLGWGRRTLSKTPVVGRPMYETLHGVKKGVKDIVAPQGMFEDLGIKYLGPIDGHVQADLERALRQAKHFPGPVIVHCLTQKGRGYGPAEADVADHFHGVGVIDPVTGQPTAASGPTWTKTFSDALVAEAARRPEVVAITAAMAGPTGLGQFAERFPDRFFDVGIAEQHAVTSAVGLAMGGCHPVVALYATFLNRAYDQVLLDAALHQAPITIALDRSGVTGDDGPSHNGMWDLPLMAGIPGIRVAAPRDAVTLVREFGEALDIKDGPTVVRYPKGALPAELPALRREGSVDILAEWGTQALIIGVGAMATNAVAAGELLVADGVNCTVADPRWVLPISNLLVELAGRFPLVVVVEDGSTRGGIAANLGESVPNVVSLGIPPRFLDQGRRGTILAELGLNPEGIAQSVAKAFTELRHHPSH